jgi:hypothetical protein
MAEGQRRAKLNAGDRGPQTACVRLPGFINEQEIGLGDIIRRVTYALSIEPCTGCEKRAAMLNSWLAFYPKSGRTR